MPALELSWDIARDERRARDPEESTARCGRKLANSIIPTARSMPDRVGPKRPSAAEVKCMRVMFDFDLMRQYSGGQKKTKICFALVLAEEQRVAGLLTQHKEEEETTVLLIVRSCLVDL